MASKIKKAAEDLYNQGKALVAPDKSIDPSLMEKQGNVDDYENTKQVAAERGLTPVGPLGTAMNSGARYGDRPGEQRIDTSEMTKPLGSALSFHKDGGKLDPDKVNVVGEDGPEEIVGDEVIPLDHTEERNPLKQLPEDEEKGAPADFAGPVYPNPMHVRPQMDTEPADIPKATVPMDMSNPAPAQVIPGREKEGGVGGSLSSTGAGGIKPKPLGGEQETIQRTGDEGSPQAPDAMKILSDQRNAQAADVAKQREQIHEDKKVATEKGDLVGLGMAKIHENELNKNEAERTVMNEAVGTPAEGGPNPAQPVYTGSDKDLGKANQAAAHHDLEAKKAELKQQLLSPDLVVVGNARRQLAELEKQNPYGSAANHPGILGKIEHGLAKAGNIAGDVLAPGATAIIPGTDLHRSLEESRGEGEVKQGEANKVSESEQLKNQALAKNAGIGKTNNERVYQSLLHGGPDGGPQQNPDTKQPYTEQEALLAAQGTGKTPEEEYVQARMKDTNPDTNQPFSRTEATQDFELMKAGTKPLHGKDKAVQDYLKANKLEDTPENRDAAAVTLEKRDAEAKFSATLPLHEQQDRFRSQLTEERTRLQQAQADALARGKSADEMQAKENQRSSKVQATLEAAKNALKNSDHDQFAASIVPVVATMAISNAEGIKRLNPIELKKFSPESGSLYRWAEAHADKFLAGDIPDEYRQEVGNMLTRFEAAENAEHLINTEAVDNTIRTGAVQPKVNPKTGAADKSEPSTKQKPQEQGKQIPPDLPKEAVSVLRDPKTGEVKGYKTKDGTKHPYVAK